MNFKLVKQTSGGAIMVNFDHVIKIAVGSDGSTSLKLTDESTIMTKLTLGDWIDILDLGVVIRTERAEKK